MISTFNLEKLTSLLEDFYHLTQIRITVFDDDFHELAAFPVEPAKFCQMIRRDETGRKNCQLCDQRACEKAAKYHEPYTYRCHAGLTESITPIYMSNIVIGYLLFGHVFSYESHEAGWEVIEKLCEPYHLDMNILKQQCWERPIISKDYITSASHILQAVATYLCMERMVSMHHTELPVQIDTYIGEHFTEEDLNVMSICEHFNIGKTQLYEIGKANYGIGIAEHIRNLKIDLAKRLLIEEPTLSLAQVASQCGFKDYNYFITVFKRLVGVSPRKFTGN